MQSRTILTLGVFVVWMTLAGVAILPAQQQPAQQPAQQDDEVETFRVDVNLVNLFFNAKDRRGGLLAGLTKDNFEVLEDGKPQSIKHFSAEANQPLTLGLLVDTSGSMERVLEVEREVASQFLREVIRPKDLAFLISFDVNVDLLHDLTSDPADLRSGLKRAKVNTGGGGGGLPGLGGGPIPNSRPRGTLLHDAVYLASYEKLAREVGRKALVVLTDGVDQGSRKRLEDSIEAAHKADAIVYVLLVEDPYFAAQGGYNGEGDMKKMAEQTGGRLIRVGDDREKMQEAFQQISTELRTQYNVAYTPTNQKRDGSFRKIEIKLKGAEGKVQARKGYFAPTGSEN